MPVSTTASNLDNVLSTRRALLADPLSTQVNTWLMPLYSGPIGRVRESAARTTVKGVVAIVGQMVAEVEPAVKSNASVRTALQSVSTFISTPLSATHAQAFQKVSRPTSGVLGTFVSVVYARALVLLLSSTGVSKVVSELKTTLSNPTAAIEKYLAEQKQLDPNFIGHLVTYSEIEAQLDPHFQTVTERASKLFVQTHMTQKEARNPLSEKAAGLDLLSEKNSSAWWQLPASLAFAMTISS